MLIINNDLCMCNDVTKKAVESKDTEAITSIVNKAKEAGFNAISVCAGSSDNEADNLLYLIDQVKDSGLKVVIRIKNTETYEKVLPELSFSGIINPVKLTMKQADIVFPLLKKLADGWEVLITQPFGDDSVSAEVEDSIPLIRKAESQGILPNRIYFDPVGKPIDQDNAVYLDTKTKIDAIKNSYPQMNFYLNLSKVAEGLHNEMTLVNAFITLVMECHVNAYAFGLDHKDHIKTLEATMALLDSKVQDYLKKNE